MNIKPTKAMITFLVSYAVGLAVVCTLLVVPGRYVEIAMTKLTDYPVSIHFPEEVATWHPS